MTDPHRAADLPVHIREFFGPSRELRAKWSIQRDALQQKFEELAAPSPIIRETSLLVRPGQVIVLPNRQPGVIFCAPKLVLNEVTRHLSWEEQTWKQKVIEDTERQMLGPRGWSMWEEPGALVGVDPAKGPDSTAFVETLWSELASAMQLPSAYVLGKNGPKALHQNGDKKIGG